MKKKLCIYFGQFRLATSFFIFLKLIPGIANGQIANINIPAMFVYKDTSLQREANFEFKKAILSEKLGNEETGSIFYPITPFRNMIAFFQSQGPFNLRVYIAAYDDGKSGVVPKGYKNKLTLIFSPEDLFSNPLGFYSITPSGTWDTSIDSCNLTKNPQNNVANIWINNYLNNNLKWLKDTLDKNDPNNYDRNQTFSDTKSIRYGFDSILNLINEVDNQWKYNGIKITGIKAIFSAFTEKFGDEDYGNLLKDRLTISYEFTKSFHGRDIILYLEDTNDFYSRKFRIVHDSANNGQLCPPANGCPN